MDAEALLDPAAAGYEALDRGDWLGACRAFEAILEQDAEHPDALDGLGQARWWLNQLDVAIELRSRAYGRFVEAGEAARAARIAAWLAREYFTVHGNLPAAGGWIGRADTLLRSAARCPERGWLALIKLALSPDPEVMKGLAAEALQLADEFADRDLAIVGLSAKGLAHVCACEMHEGMACLDEAMAAATGGELRSFWSLSDVYCNTLLACERAGDFERAEQWCRVVNDFTRRFAAEPLFPFCHVTFGAILTATGRWTEAEEELEQALRLFAAGHRAIRVIALARMAELRLKQGRLEEAGRLLDGYEEHPLAIRPVVGLYLATRRPALARETIRRRLGQLTVGSLLTAPLLALLVEVELAAADAPAAAGAAAALGAVAAASNQDLVLAEAAMAAGAVAVVNGEPEAAEHLLRALTLFGRLEMPLEAARARLVLSRARGDDEREVGVADAQAALATFERLGARRDFDEAAEQLRGLGQRGPGGPRGFGVLTRREGEVLRLLAWGHSNASIAGQLFISAKTVEHHVGRIMHKLGLRSRAEAAAYAVRQASEQK
jgi:DNA-binding NarL/FixJ family response regulator